MKYIASNLRIIETDNKRIVQAKVNGMWVQRMWEWKKKRPLPEGVVVVRSSS